MSATIDVIFEKKIEDRWQPVKSVELRPGDVARMRMLTGEILRDDTGRETFQVANINGRDPDSAYRFDVSIEPMR